MRVENSPAPYARGPRSAAAPVLPGKTHTCAIEEFTAFLVQFLGGPSEAHAAALVAEPSESHARFKIGPAEKEAWMANMRRALDDVQTSEPVRTAPA